MKRLMKKIGLFGSGIMLATVSSNLFAVGTDAGVEISNLATLSFQVGGVDQTPIESSGDPLGNSIPGVDEGAPTIFVVDRLLDLTVTAVDAAPIEVAPGANEGTTQANSIALVFTVENTGNSVQNVALQAVNTNEPALTGLTTNTADDFDPTATTFRYYLDDGNGVLDAADTLIADATPGGAGAPVPVLPDQAQDTPVTVFVVAQIPGNTDVSLDDVAAISLVAALAEPTTDDDTAGNLGTAGALILDDDAAIADTNAGIEDVLADGEAGEVGVDGSFDFVVAALNVNLGDDTAGNAQASDTAAYIILTPDISVLKTATTVCDNTNLATNPKAIPGAVVRYRITVANAAGSGASAVLTRLDDLIPVNTALTVLRDYDGAAGATCADFTALGGGDNEFRAACTDAAGGASPRADCADGAADAFLYFDQTAGDGVDSDGLAAGNTITVCYNDQDATGAGNDCTAGTVVLSGDGANPAGELAEDQAVFVEFDVIVQ